MTSNAVVAKHDVCKCALLAIQFKIELAAVAESVALFTHCRDVQLSECCQPSQITHAKIKNCKFFGPNELKSIFLVNSHACMREYLAKSGVKQCLRVVQAV